MRRLKPSAHWQNEHDADTRDDSKNSQEDEMRELFIAAPSIRASRRVLDRHDPQLHSSSSSIQTFGGHSLHNSQHINAVDEGFIATNAEREMYQTRRARRVPPVTNPFTSLDNLFLEDRRNALTFAPMTPRKRKAQTPSPPRQDSNGNASSQHLSIADALASSSSEKDTTDDPFRKLLTATSIDGPSIGMRYSTNSQVRAAARTVITPLAYAYPDQNSRYHSSMGPEETSGMSKTTRTSYSSLATNSINRDVSESILPTEWDESVRVKITQPKAKQPRSKAAQSLRPEESDIFARLTSGDKRWKGKTKPADFADATPRPDPSQPSERPLESERIPVEIFELIIAHVSWTDIKNMRLIDHTWEDRVSPSLFKQVVVPFNPQVYGTMGSQPALTMFRKAQKASLTKPVSIDLDIFPGFGEHIRQFGMSFDLDLYALANPPTKNLQEGLDSFWGYYQWPFGYYRRFEDRAELEVAADETQIMKRAFSHLTNTNHLGLVLDCGLGWLTGPDCSIRARVLKGRNKLFGSSHAVEQRTLDQRALWQQLEELYRKIGATEALKSAEIVRHKEGCVRNESPDEGKLRSHSLDASFLSDLCFDAGVDLYARSKSEDTGKTTSSDRPRPVRDYGRQRPDRCDEQRANIQAFAPDDIFEDTMQPPQTRSSMTMDIKTLESKIAGAREDCVPAEGILYTRPVINGYVSSRPSPHVLVPGTLTASQKEWLLETAWAQEAFLSSYMIAVTDNSGVSRQISKLTLSKMSSRHIGKLCRPDFWAALSGLKELDLKVIADHRDVQKTQAGFATVNAIEPSLAVTNVHYLLQYHVASMRQLETLSVGWMDGGEHAEGVIARNRLLLPAPILPKTNVESADALPLNMLNLPHIRHLELVNCWITPNALEAFILASRQHDLEKLTLTSVSMTMHPRFRGNNAQPGVQNLQMILAQQLAQLPQLQGALAAAAAAAGLVAGGGAAPAAGGAQMHGIHGQQQATAVAQVLQNLQQLANGHIAAPQINQAVAGAVQQVNIATNNALGHSGVQALINALNVQVPAQLPNLPNAFNPNQNQQQAQQGAREGSWANVFERVRLALTQEEKTDFEMQLFSCGYARLAVSQFDQALLDQVEATANLANPLPASTLSYATARKAQFQDKLIQTSDGNLASLSAALPGGEMADLHADWGLEAGWPSKELLGDEYDGDGGWGRWGAKSKQAAEYDGCRTGGSGRFSGRITNWVALSEDDV